MAGLVFTCERREAAVALHILTEALDTHCGLELVLGCELSSYQPHSHWLSHSDNTANIQEKCLFIKQMQYVANLTFWLITNRHKVNKQCVYFLPFKGHMSSFLYHTIRWEVRKDC